MPDLGIGEALAAFGGTDLLAGLFGGGEAAAAGAAGTGAALAGPTVAGTVLDTLGQGTFDALSGSALAGTGADVASTAGSFLAAPAAVGTGAGIADLLGTGAAASGANAAASTAAATGLPSGISSLLPASAPADAFAAATPTAGFGTTAIGSSSLPSNVANAQGSASVFETGTSPVTGTGSGFAPGTGAPGASSVAAPTGVGVPTDATAAGAQGAGQAAGQAAGTAAKTTSITDLLSKLSPSNLLDSTISSITKNPLPVALGAAGLGYNIFSGMKQTANEKALSADAATATNNSNTMVQQGEALQQYLTSGTLPPQYMQQVDQAIQSAKTQAISNAAAQGQPTDPTKNSSLAATLAGIDNQRAGMISQVAGELFNSGSSLVNAGATAAGLSGQLYQALVSNDTAQAGNIGKAIATLASALNGKSTNSVGGLTISTG